MQKIHLQYKDDDSTYMLNNLLTGIITAGVYRGYALAGVTERTLQLEGDAYEVSEDSVVRDKVSILRTPQGCMVKETEAVSVTLDANTNSVTRVDLIYCEHKYTEVQGGTEAVYKIKSGTESDIPTITDARTQVPIALVSVPSNWTGGADRLEYKRFPTPDFADDKTVPHTNRKNVFNEEQTFTGTKKQIADCTVSAGVMSSDKKGYDLYKFGSESEQSSVEVTSFDLGSSYGKTVQILLVTPCHFKNTEIYTPNGTDTYYANKGDMLTVLDITGDPLQGKKWVIVSSSSLKRDSNGNYIMESDLTVRDLNANKVSSTYASIDSMHVEGNLSTKMLTADKALFDGMVGMTINVTNVDTHVDFSQFGYIEIRSSVENAALIGNIDTLKTGKKIIVTNLSRNTVSIKPNYELKFGVDIKARTIATLLKTENAGLQIIASGDIILM